MLSEIPAEQLRSAVETCARGLLAEAGVFHPPVDAAGVARRLGLDVVCDTAAEVRGRLVRLADLPGSQQGTILLADEPRPERRQWAIAHEIGELAAHRMFVELGIATVEIASSSREQIANRLANALLLPREWFLADGRAVDWDLYELKEIYATASHELIARRLLDMPPPVIVTLFDQGELQWRRANLPGRAPPLIPAEREVWQAAFEIGDPAFSDRSYLPDGIEDVRCWPVHEPGWRREILRTSLEVW